MSFIMSLLLTFFLFNNIRGQTVVSPTVTNSSGEYYFLDNTSLVSQPSITCSNSAGCYVECSGTSACLKGEISSSSTNSLIIKCISGTADGVDSGACEKLTVKNGPILSADIDCIGDQACSAGYFFLTNTDDINIKCDNTGVVQYTSDGACYYAEWYGTQATNFNVDCVNTFDCYYSIFDIGSLSGKAIFNIDAQRSFYGGTITAGNAASVQLNCNNDRSCMYAKVTPPYTSQYVFSLKCAAISQSCNSMDITIGNGNVLPNNFMQLICPTDNSITNACNINYICGNAQSTMAWNAGNTRYECDDQACCPWSNFDNMTKPPTSNPTVYPSSSPTSKPSRSPLVAGQTHSPSPDPTDVPSVSPTDNSANQPSADPADHGVVLNTMLSFMLMGIVIIFIL